MPSIKGRLKRKFAQGGLTGAAEPIAPDYSNTEQPGVAAAIPGAEQVSTAASDTMAAGRAEQQAAYDQFKAGDNSGLINQGFGLAAGTIGNEGLPEAAPRFYSKLRQVVEQKMGGSAAPEHIMGMIREVKPEEVAHHGVEQFLAGKPKVTKEEMLAHLDSVTPQINEVVKGGANAAHGFDEVHTTYGEPGNHYNLVEDAPEGTVIHNQGPFATEEEAVEDARQAYDNHFGGDTGGVTKYNQYTLPGGENYRENLYTLPEKKAELDLAGTHYGPAPAIAGLRGQIGLFNQEGKIIGVGATRESAAANAGRFYKTKEQYKSSHFDEPNIIAHTRVNDRVTPEGEKVLHAEEIQSDWHQAGREKGYKGVDSDVSIKPSESGYGIFTRDGERVGFFNTEEEAKQASKLPYYRQQFGSSSGVPDAPLKKTWHEFAANNLLREAAEKNYDRVSWTTGEQQAERYDLSKQVSEIRYEKLSELEGGTFGLRVKDPNGNDLSLPKKLFTADELDGAIGKEMADKIRKGEGRDHNAKSGMKILEGLDLKVGGEGMKGFYDKIIPNYMNKIGKKYGVKVEPMPLSGGDPYWIWDKKNKEFVQEVNSVSHGEGIIKDVYEGDKNLQVVRNADRKKDLGHVHSIKLTPEMKADLLKKGFPMFAAGGMVGSSNYAEGGEVDIDRELAKAALPMPEMSAASAPSVLAQTPPPAATPVKTAPSAQINMVNPDGNLVSIPASSMQEALDSGYSHPEEDQVEKASMEAKYGTPGEMAKAGAEAVGRGVLGSTLTQGIESTFGVNPLASRAREEANPGIAGIGEAAGFLGSAFTGVGEAAVLAKAGRGLEAAAGLGKAGKISQFGAELSKAAFEGALYQGDKEAHRLYTEDPNQVAESAWSHIGAVGIISGIFGGPIGYALRPGAEKAASELAGNFVSGVDMPAVEAGDLRAVVEASDAIPAKEKKGFLSAFDLGKKKANAGEIKAAAKEIGADVYPGMDLESPLVQTQLDALSHSHYTVSGRRVGEVLDNNFSKADSALQGAISSGSTESKAELGNSLKDGLTGRIRAQYEPIKQVYDELAGTHAIIPIEGDVAASLAKDLKEIPEFRVSPSSPQGALVKQIFNDVKNVKTVADLKILKDGLSLPNTASSQEKRMVSILRDKLTEIEEGAVDRFAKSFPRNDEAGAYIQSLVEQKKAITPVYKKYIAKVSELSEQLGKGRVHGTEDALAFLNERLTPEQVAGRLFAKNNSEFLGFFSKNFPEEFQQVRNYQRAAMKEAAHIEDHFSPRKFITAFNKLEPEIQKSLFSPAEIKKINAVNTYISEFPKNYNPSGTSHVMALRQAFESPKGMIIANARDYAIEKAIQMASKTQDGRQAIQLAQATVKGEKTANKAITAIFNKSKDMPAAVIPLASSRVALDKLVTKMAVDPSKLVAMNDNNTSVPEYSAAFAAAAARTVNYLASLKPNTSPTMPLDSKRPVNPMEKAAYERALDIAQQPLVVLNHMNDGRVTPSDVIALRTMYPSLYQNLASKMTSAVADQVQKGQVVPYKIRMGLSLFLGQPLDSTMTPQAIMSIQMGMQPKGGAPSPQPSGNPSPAANKTKGLSKIGTQSQTANQAREAERAAGK